MKMGVHWGSLPQGALARTRERRVGFELELWSWTRRGVRAGGGRANNDWKHDNDNWSHWDSATGVRVSVACLLAGAAAAAL